MITKEQLKDLMIVLTSSGVKYVELRVGTQDMEKIDLMIQDLNKERLGDKYVSRPQIDAEPIHQIVWVLESLTICIKK